MTDRLPTHATLPLWADKNDNQKHETFVSMLEDLNVYRGIQGLESISIAFEGQLDELMSGYREVFSESHSNIIEWLGKAVPADDIEKEHISNTIKFIEENPNALNMNCEVGHITGSALVVDKETNKILLHKHKKYDRYLQFGGHPDYEFLPINIAFRETAEESSLNDLICLSSHSNENIPMDVDAHVIAEKNGKPEHTHFDLRYIFQTSAAHLLKANAGESNDFKWFDIQEALETPDEVISYPVKRLIRKVAFV